MSKMRMSKIQKADITKEVEQWDFHTVGEIMK